MSEIRAQAIIDLIGDRSIWDEDEEFPVSDWRYEVINDDTRLGYWEWVFCRREEKYGQTSSD